MADIVGIDEQGGAPPAMSSARGSAPAKVAQVAKAKKLPSTAKTVGATKVVRAAKGAKDVKDAKDAKDDKLDRLLEMLGELTAQPAQTPIADVIALVAELRADIFRVRDEVREVRQLVGPFAATFPNGSMLCQTIHGVKYFIDPDDLIIAPQMVIYRQWEARLSALFRQLCTRDTVFVDVGANFGYFTCLAGALIGQGGAGLIHAFEPNPKLVSLLRKNVEINWSMAPIIVHPTAVADEAGVARLSIPDGHGANATLSALEDDRNATVVDVQMVRLDDTIPTDLTVDLLKIDVEGHELKVLLGARGLIARSPDIKIIMEWSQDQMRDAGINVQDVADLVGDFACYDTEAGDDPFDHARDGAWLLDQAYANILLTRR